MRLLELLVQRIRKYELSVSSALATAVHTFVFGEFDLGSLLEGLALGPRPAVAGLGEELRTIDPKNLGARHEVYLRSRLSLTEFGKAVLAHQEDFSRHNPIDRWWGGTHLTNDRLWRYGAALTKPETSGMTRLIVTTDSSIAGAIQRAGIADLVIAIERRLVWGQLPSMRSSTRSSRRVRRSLEAFTGSTIRRPGDSKNLM